MRLILSFLTGAVALGLASPASAQQRAPAPKKQQEKAKIAGPERCVTEDGRVECRIFRRSDTDSVLMKRAALGIELSSTGTARDTIGVFVARVTPKGPAENAGIYEGDRIVSINGIDLRVNAADAGDSYAAGLPARRLTREVQKVNPGSAVNLRVWSGGRVRDVQVTTGRASDLRERRSFGYMFDGMPGVFGFGERPLLRMESFPRMQLKEFQRVRPQDWERLKLKDFPRMRFDDLQEFEQD